EAPEREYEQDLAELGRLEAEEAEIEPTLGTANRASEEHDCDQERGAAEDHAPTRPVEIRIDERRDEQTKHPDHDVDGLAREVVALIARNVVVRDACDRPEPVADEGPDATEQDPVEAPDEGRDLGRLAPAGAGCCTGVGDVVDHLVAVDRAGLGRLLAEERLEDLERSRRGCIAAVAAVLDQ